jgi:hypothetical protein
MREFIERNQANTLPIIGEEILHPYDPVLEDEVVDVALPLDGLQ